MRAAELQIGDWVRREGCTRPSRVAGVTSSRVHTIWADGTKHAKDEYYFNPIAITPELLLVNGWMMSNDVCYTRERSKAGVECWLEWRESNKTLFINEGLVTQPILYVHQLQHVLRLCGLNDLGEDETLITK